MRYIAILLILSSCTPRVITQEVLVPVSVPCINKDSLPPVREMTHYNLKESDSIFTKTKSIMTDLKGLESDVKILMAITSGCVDTQKNDI